MILAKLIRKGGLAHLATATLATPATELAATVLSVAEVASVAVANPPGELGTEEETTIRAWLEYIEEFDPRIVDQVMELARDDHNARKQLLQFSLEIPARTSHTRAVSCDCCKFFRRTDHPNLGHCAQGQREDAVGLWDTDMRLCESYLQRSKNQI